MQVCLNSLSRLLLNNNWVTFYFEIGYPYKRQSVQCKNGTSKICGRFPLEQIWSDQRLSHIGPYHFKFFKGFLPQILLFDFLSALHRKQLLVSTHDLSCLLKIENVFRHFTFFLFVGFKTVQWVRSQWQ